MKIIITSFYTLIIIFFLSSCSAAKINKKLKEGRVKQENFKTTIPFVYKNGWIVIEVEIQNRKYNFIVDTGASNILSKELAEDLKVASLGITSVKDIKNESKDIKFASVENIRIGNLDFEKTITGIIDINEIVEIGCAKIDGLIGSSLMRKAIWDFDFEKQLITITDKEEKLEIPEDVIESKLFIGTAGIPSIIVNINGKRILNNVIDFGNPGPNLLSMKYFKKQTEKKIIKNYLKGTQKSFGVFGRSEWEPYYATIIDEMKVGNRVVNDIYTEARVGAGNNLGLAFFKNYRVILNWEDKKIKMIQKKEVGNDSYSAYGYSTIYKEGSIYIASIIENSSASKFLKQEDKVLQIDGVDCKNITKEQYCDFWNTIYNGKPLSIIVLRNGEEFSFELTETKLL